ncbi:MAG: hypothetical protein C0507_23730 [Cyanobacteria bacterium PR.3.49]|nr:hypothetical protein [Cyanobacteria bacterium PR.3.49]
MPLHAVSQGRSVTDIDSQKTIAELTTEVTSLKAELRDAQKLIEYIGAELRTLRAKPYAAKGEGLSDEQLHLLLKDMEIDQAMRHDVASLEDSAKEVVQACRPERPEVQKGGRRKLPDHLPRKEIVLSVKQEELLCQCCGGEKRKIGTEASEQLEIVPAKFFVVRYLREKFACPKCAEQVSIAPPAPKPIPRGNAGSGVIAMVAVSRFASHLPWYRQENILARCGHTVGRSTQWSWAFRGAKVLEPLIDELKRRVLLSEVIWTDDTPVKIQDKKVKKRLPESRIWTYRGDSSNPYIFFEFTRTRRRDGPKTILDLFNGYLVADAYAGYDCVYASGNVIEAACFAHVRRKFFESLGGAGPIALEALLHIRQLYRVEQNAEKLCRDQKLSKTEFHALRLQMRRRYSTSRLQEFKAWLEKQKEEQLPQSRIGKAIRYTLKNWTALNSFLENGEVTLDNNLAENILRKIALGRKNWLFFGGEEGGRVAATYATIIASAARHGLDPFVYLRDVFTRLSQDPKTPIATLLPDEWEDKTSGYYENLCQLDAA